MGILNNLGATGRGILGGFGGRGGSVSAGLKPFRDVLKIADFTTADVELVASKWIDIGSKTVGAKQEIHVGYGTPQFPEDAGFIYVRLDDTAGNQIKGKFRILIKDANEVGKATVFNEDLVNLSGDKNDRAKKIMLPEDFTPALEDEKITIQVFADSTTTFDYDDADTYVAIPITVRYLSAK